MSARAVLGGALRHDFDRWLEAGVDRCVPPLSFQEVRRGVRALSSLYVERRQGADLAARAHEGSGKRAALATYYAPLHFLAAHGALAEIGPERLGAPPRVVDLGCGTGASGAAAARSFPAPPPVLGLDRSGFALGEARRCWSAFGLRGRARRTRLPAGLPRPLPGELLVLGWTVNELPEPDRDALAAWLRARVVAGSRLLLLEPLSGRASPWWSAWSQELAPLGVEDRELRCRPDLPGWIARLDRAAGLDHRELGARVLAGPLSQRGGDGCVRGRSHSRSQRQSRASAQGLQR